MFVIVDILCQDSGSFLFLKLLIMLQISYAFAAFKYIDWL